MLIRPHRQQRRSDVGVPQNPAALRPAGLTPRRAGAIFSMTMAATTTATRKNPSQVFKVSIMVLC
jgi:hypothetical protein